MSIGKAKAIVKSVESGLTYDVNLCLSPFRRPFFQDPGLAGFTEAIDDGGGGDNWSYSCAKLQSNRHRQQTNT